MRWTMDALTYWFKVYTGVEQNRAWRSITATASHELAGGTEMVKKEEEEEIEEEEKETTQTHD